MISPSPLEISVSQTRWSYDPEARRPDSDKDNSRYDFITFLETCQNLEVDFLPVTWQPALDTLGVGGQSEVRQSMISLAMSFAFHRVKPPGRERKRDDDDEDEERGEHGKERHEGKSQENEEQIYRALVSQVSILQIPKIQYHPNIVHLIGVCWDIRVPSPENDHSSRSTEERQLHVLPVLVTEKTKHGDLKCFMKSAGSKLDFAGRLKLCIDIASGIRDLHSCRTTHGDIKPHNILISEDESGIFTAKIADFGWSLRFLGEDDYGYMTRSIPWQAPEWHDRGHLFSETIQMDIYSFGLVCFWLLYNEKLHENDIRFDALPDQHPHPLESKKQNGLQTTAERLAQQILQSLDNFTGDLELFFRSCLAWDPENRASDMRVLIENLGAKLPRREAAVLAELRDDFSITSQPLRPFEISQSICSFYNSDYRLRTYIASCVLKRLNSIRGTDSCEYSQQLSFQLAVCYRLGFGLAKNFEEEEKALQRSGRSSKDLNAEIRRVFIADYTIRNEIFRKLNSDDLDTRSDIYRNRIAFSLADAQLALQKDLATLSSVLCDVDSIPVPLTITRATLAYVFFERGLWDEAERLLIQLIEGRLIDHDADEHPPTLRRMSNLAQVYRHKGQWKKAEELMQQVIKLQSKVLGAEHISTLNSIIGLASIYESQRQLREAEKLQLQVTRISLKTLGAEHPSTLNIMTGLATKYWGQGRWKEAEELQLQVLNAKSRVLGAKHPATLTSIAGLASTYWGQGRLKMAEELQMQFIVEGSKIMEAEDPSMLTNKANLALTYQSQERWKEAEELHLYVIEKRSKVLGAEHPSTLISVSNLASTYKAQERWQEAEELLLRVIEPSRRVLGAEHPSTLNRMTDLVIIYCSRKWWKEAEELHVQVMDAKSRISGAEHPSTPNRMDEFLRAFIWAKGDDEFSEHLQAP